MGLRIIKITKKEKLLITEFLKKKFAYINLEETRDSLYIVYDEANESYQLNFTVDSATYEGSTQSANFKITKSCFNNLKAKDRIKSINLKEN